MADTETVGHGAHVTRRSSLYIRSDEKALTDFTNGIKYQSCFKQQQSTSQRVFNI